MQRFNEKYNSFGFVSLKSGTSVAGAQIPIKALVAVKSRDRGFLYLSSPRSLMPDLSGLLSSVTRRKQSKKSQLPFNASCSFLGQKSGHCFIVAGNGLQMGLTIPS